MEIIQIGGVDVKILVIGVTILLSVFFLGCTTTSNDVKLSNMLVIANQQYITFIENDIEMMRKLAKVAAYESIVLKKSLGINLSLLNHESVKLLNDYERLGRIALTRELTIDELGEMRGYRNRFFSKPVIDIIKLYAPEFFNWVAVLLSMV